MTELQLERERLIGRLAGYRQVKPCEITVVFDGWEGGAVDETREKRRGVEVIFSRLGEKADDVIKRLIRAGGSGVVAVTSDREISRYGQKIGAPVIPAERFQMKMESALSRGGTDSLEDEEPGAKRKGPSRRASKEERRAEAVLKKL